MDDFAGCCLLILLVPVGLFISGVGVAVCFIPPIDAAKNELFFQILPFIVGAGIVLFGLGLSVGSIWLLITMVKDA